MFKDIALRLGYPDAQSVDERTADMIRQALQEVAGISEFKYIHSEFSTPPEFLLQHIEYQNYLSGCSKILLCVTTLGIAIDRKIKQLQIHDMPNAVIFDAAAGVFLEHQADQFEKELPYEELGFRFCPGYNGTQLSDNKEIIRLTKAEKIGISCLDSGMILPSKTMAGIIGVGVKKSKNCVHCLMQQYCDYRKRGTTCYHH